MKLVRQSVDPRHLGSVTALSAHELRSLLGTGQQLREASRRGALTTSLRGRNLALLCRNPDAEATRQLHRAATELGAQVAQLRAADTGVGQGRGNAAAVRLLGRLYDAIDCDALDPEGLDELARETGVPVYDGLAGDWRPARTLAELLPLPERCGKPFDALRLAFRGDPAAPGALALRHVAQACGIELCDCQGDGPPADSCDALIDVPPGQSWQLPGVDAAERSANHRITLQAMLMTTMA